MESNIEKNSDELDSIIESTLKSIFNNLPVVGGVLNEVMFDYSGRIKQQRLNRFVELLKDYFDEKSDLNINIENLKTEDFHDLFESVMMGVTRTSSEEKLKRFRNIILNHIKGDTDISMANSYIDIISKIDDNQIKILNEHKFITLSHNHRDKFKKDIDIEKKNNLNPISRQSLKRDEEIKKNLAKWDEELKTLDEKRKASHYGLSNKQYDIYLHDLIAKGLLKEGGAIYNIEPDMSVTLTSLGEAFIDFIISNDKKFEPYF